MEMRFWDDIFIWEGWRGEYKYW